MTTNSITTTTPINKNVEDIIQDNMMGYASYVLLDRCLPDIRDGLKPVYRRILFTMYLQKAFRFTKSANVEGQVMKLHPHGSSYGSMVSMVQQDKQSIPYLIGKGNFGSHTSRDLAPAASRYSEVKLSELAIDMMKNFEKNLVNFIDNYDGTMKMPEVLPVKFPTILTHSQSGIGVGFASSTPSFNLNELCDSMIEYLKTGKETILVPDFATGGTILNDVEVFKKLNYEGNGTVRLRGKAEIDGNEILITEIPYTTTREAIIDKIIELAKTGRLKEVTNVVDLTGLKGMLISVTARRGTDMNLLLEKLYRYTPLQSTHSSNMNILVDNLPKVLGVWPIIKEWLAWRRDCIKRGLAYDIDKMTNKLHILRGLEKVLLDIDKTIEIIRFSEESLIEPNLQAHFNIDEEQAKNVSNMKLRNINRDYIIKQIKDIEQLEKDIQYYKELAEDENGLNNIIIKDLNEAKEKYGRARITQIVEPTSQVTIPTEKVEVSDYPVRIHLTKDGYCYKFKNSELEPTLKPGDEILQVFDTTNKGEVIIVTDACMGYKVPISKIEETNKNSLGTYLLSTIKAESESIVNYSVYDETRKYVIVAYRNNKIAKVDMKAWSADRRVLKHGYKDGQEVVDMITLSEDSKLKVVTTKTEVEINTEDYKAICNRTAQGTYVTRKGELVKVEVV